jgi:hypothetical protein
MKNRTLYRSLCLLAATALLVATDARDATAKNVDLVTLPSRETTELTIYNAEDLTLVRERRTITLKKGRNRLQFSWANTLIDPSSIEMRPIEHADEIEIADTVLPGQKPQHLIWNIESQREGQALVEVSYFTSGLTWQMDYVSITNPGETEMLFRGHVRVFNQSGEEYENATIRLIVGKIHLVEKIADLARRAGVPVPQPSSKRYDRMKSRAAARAFADADEAATEGSAASGIKGVVKEGVSEYFMFSVDGTETIQNGWSKRMQAVEAADVKFDIVYRLRDYQYGRRPVRFFVWRNDDEHRLGESPLPDGRVRIFRENGQDGLSFLGEQQLLYVPIDAAIEVNLGVDDLVVYEKRLDDTQRFNFNFHNRHVRGWDETQTWIHTVRNYRKRPIVLELRLQYAGDIDFTTQHATKSFDYRTIETKLQVDARDRTEYPHTVTIHHGTNAKQQSVKLKRAR